MKTNMNVLKTFFKVNKSKDLKYPNIHIKTRSTKRLSYTPTVREALKMIDFAGTLKHKAIIAVLSGTGLRNSTLRALQYGVNRTNRLAFSGNTIKNQLDKDEKNLMIVIDEGMKKMVSGSAKRGIFYYNFTPAFVTECIKLYLKERVEKHDEIKDDEYLFPSDYRKYSIEKRKRTPISKDGLEKIVRDTARKTGLKHWKYTTPQSLRRTYNKFLKNQAADVRLGEEDKEFLMGHVLKGSKDNYYDYMESELLREKFSKLKFGDKITKTSWLEETALFLGYDPEKVLNKFKIYDGGQHDFLKEYIKNKKKQMVIDTEKLEEFVKNNWKFISTINKKQCIMEYDGFGNIYI